MSDLVQRFQDVKSIVNDESLPKWRRATQALQALSGLELSALPIDVRTTLETSLVAVNQVLARYRLETLEDYEQMKDQDLQEILDNLGAPVSRHLQAK